MGIKVNRKVPYCLDSLTAAFYAVLKHSTEDKYSDLLLDAKKNILTSKVIDKALLKVANEVSIQSNFRENYWIDADYYGSNMVDCNGFEFDEKSLPDDLDGTIGELLDSIGGYEYEYELVTAAGIKHLPDVIANYEVDVTLLCNVKNNAGYFEKDTILDLPDEECTEYNPNIMSEEDWDKIMNHPDFDGFRDWSNLVLAEMGPPAVQICLGVVQAVFDELSDYFETIDSANDTIENFYDEHPVQVLLMVHELNKTNSVKKMGEIIKKYDELLNELEDSFIA